jgi:hypothetical protein
VGAEPFSAILSGGWLKDELIKLFSILHGVLCVANGEAK